MFGKPKPAAGHDPRAVANEILMIAVDKGKELTVMQLIKLVYLAHGWYLSYTKGIPLINDHFEAWQYGPVNPKIYKSFKKFGSEVITKKAENEQVLMPYMSKFSEDELKIMNKVMDTYGGMHAFKLSALMHKTNTPWDQTFSRGDGAYTKIPNKVIKDHFDGLGR